MIPFLAGLGFWPKLIAGAIVLGLIGWAVHSVYSSIYDRGYGRGVADTQQAERDCIDGTVCALALEARATKQREIVAAAQDAARKQAELAAAEQLKQEVAAREAAETRAQAARAAAGAAERRYQQALAANQACATWSSTIVPCPIS